MCTEGLQLHTQRNAQYIQLEHHHTNFFQVTLKVPQNQQKLNPCYKTLVRTLMVPLHSTQCTEGLQLHTQRHAYYIYLEHHTINIVQVTLHVPRNQSKLNPCYETLGKRSTLPLHGTLYNEELKTHRQRHAEYIYLEHHHINILQVTLYFPQNQLKLITCYKTLVRTLMVPLRGTLCTKELQLHEQ
jgi:hypothetical protein